MVNFKAVSLAEMRAEIPGFFKARKAESYHVKNGFLLVTCASPFAHTKIYIFVRDEAGTGHLYHIENHSGETAADSLHDARIYLDLILKGHRRICPTCWRATDTSYASADTPELNRTCYCGSPRYGDAYTTNALAHAREIIFDDFLKDLLNSGRANRFVSSRFGWASWQFTAGNETSPHLWTLVPTEVQ